METIQGRRSLELGFSEFRQRLASYDRIIIDIGTGDGRYAHSLAANNPRWFVIGFDSCRENLREHSQAKLLNMLFIVGNAQELPVELNGLIAHMSINFPRGSLLASLLNSDPQFIRGLASLSCSVTSFDVRINAGALAELGRSLETGTQHIYNNLIAAGWQVGIPVSMNASALRAFPSTWAKRLAFGRDPRAMELNGWFYRSL